MAARRSNRESGAFRKTSLEYEPVTSDLPGFILPHAALTTSPVTLDTSSKPSALIKSFSCSFIVTMASSVPAEL